MKTRRLFLAGGIVGILAVLIVAVLVVDASRKKAQAATNGLERAGLEQVLQIERPMIPAVVLTDAFLTGRVIGRAEELVSEMQSLAPLNDKALEASATAHRELDAARAASDPGTVLVAGRRAAMAAAEAIGTHRAAAGELDIYSVRTEVPPLRERLASVKAQMRYEGDDLREGVLRWSHIEGAFGRAASALDRVETGPFRQGVPAEVKAGRARADLEEARLHIDFAEHVLATPPGASDLEADLDALYLRLHSLAVERADAAGHPPRGSYAEHMLDTALRSIQGTDEQFAQGNKASAVWNTLWALGHLATLADLEDVPYEVQEETVTAEQLRIAKDAAAEEVQSRVVSAGVLLLTLDLLEPMESRIAAADEHLQWSLERFNERAQSGEASFIKAQRNLLVSAYGYYMEAAAFARHVGAVVAEVF